jgi:putative oxidoreductase
MAYLFLLGRVLLGGFFLLNAWNHFKNRNAMAGYATSKGQKHAMVAVVGSGVLLLIGGAGIVLGAFIKLSVLALALFLIPVSFKMHAYWKETDPMAKMGDRVQFQKNMALLGAVITLLFIPMPWVLSVM